MAERMEGGLDVVPVNGGAAERQEQSPSSVGEAREQIAATRQRLSQDIDLIEQRLRGTASDVRRRLDVLEPARQRIRADVWMSLAIAFGAGVAYAVLTGKRRGGRRGLAGEVLRATAGQLPAALLGGMRSGVRDRVKDDFSGHRPLPPR